jgi:hypothetical protein
MQTGTLSQRAFEDTPTGKFYQVSFILHIGMNFDIFSFLIRQQTILFMRL